MLPGHSRPNHHNLLPKIWRSYAFAAWPCLCLQYFSMQVTLPGLIEILCPGVLEGSKNSRLAFLEVLHLLVESSALCELLEGALALDPNATQPAEPSDAHLYHDAANHDASR